MAGFTERMNSDTAKKPLGNESEGFSVTFHPYHGLYEGVAVGLMIRFFRGVPPGARLSIA
jgi:hypothetical protein